MTYLRAHMGRHMISIVSRGREEKGGAESVPRRLRGKSQATVVSQGTKAAQGSCSRTLLESSGWHGRINKTGETRL